jgi:hypothetical protein
LRRSCFSSGSRTVTVAIVTTSYSRKRAASVLEAETSLSDGDNVPFQLVSLPLYLIGEVRRLCREV